MSEQPIPAEAVCFTAGPQGAAFGAGVIHAWLAADRQEPLVVAGISTGAITAAAFQKAMLRRGLEAADRTEASRWGWFQPYLTDILDRPLDVIWKAIPDPVDYFSASTPVHDLSCPDLLKDDERASRYQFWLPITIGQLGTLAILQVRRGEQIPVLFLGRGQLARAWRTSTLVIQVVAVALQLIDAIVTKPSFTRTWARFTADEKGRIAWTPGIRPLFGWRLWLTAWIFGALAVLILSGIVILLGYSVWFLVWAAWGKAALCFSGAIAVMAIGTALVAKKLDGETFEHQLKQAAERINPENGAVSAPPKEKCLDGVRREALECAGINLGLISNYQMKRRIWNRFADAKNHDPAIECTSETRTNVVIVASVLQSLAGTNHQCWAHSGTSLVSALAIACGIQPFFAPTHVAGEEEASKWLREKDLKRSREARNDRQEFDLVDGAVIRKNPLPSLFNWLQEKGKEKIAEGFAKASPVTTSIHVIYNVPIEPFNAYEGQPNPEQIDLIEAANVGMLMRARRDTNVEVQQTNYMSDILGAQRTAEVQRQTPLLALRADSIAPEREVKFANPLSPSRDEGLKLTAEGCRRTLGRLYQNEITRGDDAGKRRCSELIREIAPHRPPGASPGLPEVCAHCDGWVAPYPSPPRPPSLVQQDYGQRVTSRTNGKPPAPIQQELPGFCEKRGPKIVFVASGGVFRGAFHIGLIGAMQALKITPDLVVGASVGTLMGAALAAMRNCSTEAGQLQALADLTDTFMRVDETVALTVPLKKAVKQLGLRAHRLKLSPAALRAAIRAGTSDDFGYASTGVPPILTDTLSQLFIIPPSETVKAGSDFLAGRFAKASAALLQLIRENTLESLGIRYAVIGTSMLHSVAGLLLGAGGRDLNQRQPYLSADRKSGTAIFCTTALVSQRWPLLLGRDGLKAGAKEYSFLHAALSSSAFPAAFPARQEAEVFPGSGLISNLFCDGGTFDNLPFMPTIEILSAAQRALFQCLQSSDPQMTANKFLQDRLNAPDLIISGGFDALPEEGRWQYQSSAEVKRRCAALAASVKTDSFIQLSERAAAELQLLNNAPKKTNEADDLKVGSVVAGVVNVVPATPYHVNPTFGFARSVGFQKERVAASIADGCFQTLRSLQQQDGGKTPQVRLSLKALEIAVRLRASKECETEGLCPYFDLLCPFFQAKENTSDAKANACEAVYRSCCKDPVHRKLYQVEMRRATAQTIRQ